ncbi:hypothetical protein [Blastochloris sulfoviridis]|uniref:Uncharacterized protein n=1 Tax=Blastochloris sulfoviridis TaxID=50712 RepID=A0A5M6HRS6_9HYPH|nr:hypothetical protein [Blastochloris sulfoviridis]KAA5598209.1 hypothetical protein F1193_13560 [Blastochloris sulfoviridis]
MTDWIFRLGEGLASNIVSADWLATELPSFLLFTVVTGWFVSAFEGRRERREREPYENWNLVVKGYDDKPQALYFEDVKKFKYSEFEFFRFVKSVCSTAGDLRTKSMSEARGIWVFFDEAKREIVIDLVAIPERQIKWKDGRKPAAANESAAAPDPVSG